MCISEYLLEAIVLHLIYRLVYHNLIIINNLQLNLYVFMCKCMAVVRIIFFHFDVTYNLS